MRAVGAGIPKTEDRHCSCWTLPCGHIGNDRGAPFGGVGYSGVGREGGNFSREFFTEPKAVVMQLSPAPQD